jgi:HAMP domain-containing protein
MGLRTKLNLLLFLIALLGAGAFAAVSAPFLQKLAKDEVVQSSRIMMEAAVGARAYTSQQVAPLVEADMATTFHPQAVSAYAAMKSFDGLHQKFSDYSYREVALNPTNLEHRPADWEADIVQYFRAHPDATEDIHERSTMRGPVLNLSLPITVKQPCLVCHDTPQAAPASMTAVYGAQNGFGWKLNEIIGAQIVSVPMSVAYDRALQIGLLFLALYLGVFLLLAIVLNLSLGALVISPVMKMARVAQDVSLGKMDAPEYVRKGKDQIAVLSASFNRMRRSLEEALRMLSGPR